MHLPGKYKQYKSQSRQCVPRGQEEGDMQELREQCEQGILNIRRNASKTRENKMLYTNLYCTYRENSMGENLCLHYYTDHTQIHITDVYLCVAYV